MGKWMITATCVATFGCLGVCSGGCSGSDDADSNATNASGVTDVTNTAGSATDGSEGGTNSGVSTSDPDDDTSDTNPTSSAPTSADTGVDPDSAGTDSASSDTQGGTPMLPPANAGLDYQLGGAYDPPAGVEIVSRDRNASPAPGLYNICYVNGYQTQPDEEQWWLDEHDDLLLKDDNGDPFIDPDWDEILLDIRTPATREALAEIVGGWIAQCAADGFDAVEIDNLDTYSRSDGMISQDNAVDFMVLLSQSAHASGLAIAQKNSTEIASRQPEMDTDFAVAEECNRWDECQDYKDVYGDLVFVIEYRQQDFDAGCGDFPELSIVLRDLNLVPAGQGPYVYDGC